MRILYVALSGSSDPTRASLPFHLAVNGSAPIGHEVSVVLSGDATELVDPALRTGTNGPGLPPLVELFDKARAGQIAVYV